MAAGGPNPMSDCLKTKEGQNFVEEQMAHTTHILGAGMTRPGQQDHLRRKTSELYNAIAGTLDEKIRKGKIELVQDESGLPKHTLAVLMRLEGPGTATHLQLINNFIRGGVLFFDSEFHVYEDKAGRQHWTGGAFLKLCLIFMQVGVLQFKHCTDPADDTAVVCIFLSHYECQDLTNSEDKTRQQISEYLCNRKPKPDRNDKIREVHVVKTNTPSWCGLAQIFKACLVEKISVIAYEKKPR